MKMNIFFKTNTTASFNLIFIHGWGCDLNSLWPLAKKFTTKYNVYLLDLPGFGKTKLEHSYFLEDYLSDIECFISENKLDNIVLIGHSFGGKIACKLLLKHPEYKVIALAPSLVKNSNKLFIDTKIKCYKLLKKLHLPIPKNLLGSRDYQRSNGNLRKTFLNVHDCFFSKKEIKEMNEILVFAFKNDKEVKLKRIKKAVKVNKNIHLVECQGNHFGYLTNMSLIVRLSCFYIDGNAYDCY